MSSDIIQQSALTLYVASQAEWHVKGEPDGDSTRGDVRDWYIAMARALHAAGLLCDPDSDAAIRADERARAQSTDRATIDRVRYLAWRLINSAGLNYESVAGQALYDALNGADGD